MIWGLWVCVESENDMVSEAWECELSVSMVAWNESDSVTFGISSHKAINSMTGSSLAVLRDSAKDVSHVTSCAEWRLVLDNIQEYCPVYEGEKLHVKAYSK